MCFKPLPERWHVPGPHRGVHLHLHVRYDTLPRYNYPAQQLSPLEVSLCRLAIVISYTGSFDLIKEKKLDCEDVKCYKTSLTALIPYQKNKLHIIQHSE